MKELHIGAHPYLRTEMRPINLTTSELSGDDSQPTKISCRFKRQIKLIEKVLGQQLPARHTPIEEDEEDKPSFFFGV